MMSMRNSETRLRSKESWMGEDGRWLGCPHWLCGHITATAGLFQRLFVNSFKKDMRTPVMGPCVMWGDAYYGNHSQTQPSLNNKQTLHESHNPNHGRQPSNSSQITTIKPHQHHHKTKDEQKSANDGTNQCITSRQKKWAVQGQIG